MLAIVSLGSSAFVNRLFCADNSRSPSTTAVGLAEDDDRRVLQPFFLRARFFAPYSKNDVGQRAFLDRIPRMDDQQTSDKEPTGPTAPPTASAAPQPPALPSISPPASQKLVQKIADRPHWITMILGLLSPLLAAVALVISLQSLRTSERSLEVGQRAYVSLQGGKMTFSHITFGAPPQPTSALKRPADPHLQSRPSAQNEQVATLLLSLTIVNSGNTAAEFTRFTPDFQRLPEGWALQKQEWQPVQKAPPYLGAKSQAAWEYRASFLLTPQAWAEYLPSGPRSANFIDAIKGE